MIKVEKRFFCYLILEKRKTGGNMAELDFDRKHAEDLQRLRGFRLLDDDFMSKVFEDKACSQFLLQIILDKKGSKGTRPA